MASTRLTNDMRSAIVKALLKHRYGDEEKALCDECDALMQDAFKDVMAEAYGSLDQFPDEWFGTTTGHNIEFRGVECFFFARWEGDDRKTQIKYYVDDSYRRSCYWTAVFNKPVRIPYRMWHSASKIKGGVLHDRAANLAMRTRKHVEAYKEARETAHGILKSFSTVEKLVKEWPDIEPFIPASQVATKRLAENLPAVPVEDMRKRFKLPKVEK